MKIYITNTFILLILFLEGCITEFIPETKVEGSFLVVDGLITDQCETYNVRLSTSMPIGQGSDAKPLAGALVTVSDDLGNIFKMSESTPGTYLSDSLKFRGMIGRKYSLHIRTLDASHNQVFYESTPMEMRPVPPIDSLYYTKVTVRDAIQPYDRIEACQIYIDTHDGSDICKYYKWNYSETWEIRLHWNFPNLVCWITENSDDINIKNTSALAVNQVSRFPINYITKATDRLEVKYSILVNQYSINEEEFTYWDKMKTFTENMGGLYDQVPSSIKNNISNINDPAEPVLGYFSVSAKSSRRIFIKDRFEGRFDLSSVCRTEYLYSIGFIPPFTWVLESNLGLDRPYLIITSDERCIDCTLRGTNIKPDFWEDN